MFYLLLSFVGITEYRRADGSTLCTLQVLYHMHVYMKEISVAETLCKSDGKLEFGVANANI